MTGNECNFGYDSPRLTIEASLIGRSAGRHGGQHADSDKRTTHGVNQATRSLLGWRFGETLGQGSDR